MTPMVRLGLPGRRVCFWGAPHQTPALNDDRTPWRTKLVQTGGNTGNLFIGHGLFHATDAQFKTMHPGFGAVPAEQFGEQFDCLMIPASNFINPALDLSGVYEYFSRTKTQMVCFGLGSQIVPGEPVVLNPGTERLIRLISERSGTIGVRGAFTADIMWKMGIRNISLTGCPSMLGLSDRVLNDLCAPKDPVGRIAVNFSNNVRRHSFHPEGQRETENLLFDRLRREESFYVLQNEAHEMDLLDSIRSGGTASAADSVRQVLALFGRSPEDPDAERYVRWNTRVFWDVPSWVAMMRTMTRSVGTRFHGNVAAILAGTPALVLVHDMRTLELAELFGIPHMVMDRVIPPEEIMERVENLDYRPFLRRINLLRAEWRAFAGRNGITVTE